MVVSGIVVIITGASMGIGLATAKRFAAAGAKLVLAARSVEKLEALAGELRNSGCEALAIQTDMRDRASVRVMIDRAYGHFGRIDILISSAGQAAAGAVATMDPAVFQSILDLNLFGPLYAMQDAIPKMREVGGGIIINISSMVTKMLLPGLAPYAVSKSALSKLSDTARVELAGENIRVIAVYPKLTDTNFAENSAGDKELRRKQRASAGSLMVMDIPDFVAEKILEAAEKEPEEVFV